MKKITLLLMICFCTISAFAQFSNAVLPTEVQTNPDAGPNDNKFSGSVDFAFASQAEVDALNFMAIRIRPTAGGALAGTNTDLGILADFKQYVTDNGLSGTYAFSLDMPTDSNLPATADLVAPTEEYNTRFQTNGFQSPFTVLTVVSSGGTLSLTDNVLSTVSFKVFPNPTRGEISISGISNYQSITVFNLLGKTVKTFGALRSINISDLSSGIYLLKVDTGQSLKIIKQ